MSKKEKGKSTPPVKALAKFELINGVVVMVSPDDEPELENEDTTEVLIDNRDGIISVQTESTFLEEEVQYVIDESSASKSHQLAEKVRKENQERVTAATQEIKISKQGDVILAGSDTYDDINAVLLTQDSKLDAN